MAKPIVVIGSNSFSGANFCAHLLKQQQEVIAISRSEEPIKPLLSYKWVEHSRLQFHQLDLNHDLDDILKLLDLHKTPFIYNFAAQSMVSQSWSYPEHWFMTNTVSSVKLHNALRQRDYLDKYIHISTPEVYGNCEGSVQEHKRYSPSTPYAVSRAASDMSLHSFFDAYQFPVVFTRAANVYGEGQQLYRIIPRTILYAIVGKKLQLHGGGTSERSFIHMDDVSEATQRIGESGILGEIYHISTKRVISIRNLVQMICDLMNVPFERLCEATEERLGKDAAYLLDTTKLREQLDWRDKVSLEQGLERTVAWVKQNQESLIASPHSYIHKP